MGKRLVSQATVYYPGADESLAELEDVLRVSVVGETLEFIQNGAFSSPAMFLVSDIPALKAKLAVLLAAYDADGNGGSLEVDPSDDTKRITVDEDTGRLGLGGGAGYDTFPRAVVEEAIGDL